MQSLCSKESSGIDHTKIRAFKGDDIPWQPNEIKTMILQVSKQLLSKVVVPSGGPKAVIPSGGPKRSTKSIIAQLDHYCCVPSQCKICGWGDLKEELTVLMSRLL